MFNWLTGWFGPTHGLLAFAVLYVLFRQGII